MKRIFIVLLFMFTCGVMLANSTSESSKNEIRALRQKAKSHAAEDAERYTPSELEDIETLYREWSTKKGSAQRTVAKNLLRKYPNSNRTGCGVIYWANICNGREKRDLLRKAIKDYDDCFYFDGVQVGAFARYLLGKELLKNGKKADAEKYFEEIRISYPEAINHKKERLVDLIKK